MLVQSTPEKKSAKDQIVNEGDLLGFTAFDVFGTGTVPAAFFGVSFLAFQLVKVANDVRLA